MEQICLIGAGFCNHAQCKPKKQDVTYMPTSEPELYKMGVQLTRYVSVKNHVVVRGGKIVVALVCCDSEEDAAQLYELARELQARAIERAV